MVGFEENVIGPDSRDEGVQAIMDEDRNDVVDAAADRG